jgi:hypothetical protein
MPLVLICWCSGFYAGDDQPPLEQARWLVVRCGIHAALVLLPPGLYTELQHTDPGHASSPASCGSVPRAPCTWAGPSPPPVIGMGGLTAGRAVGPHLMSGCGPGSRATCSAVLFGVLGAHPPVGTTPGVPGRELAAVRELIRQPAHAFLDTNCAGHENCCNSAVFRPTSKSTRAWVYAPISLPRRIIGLLGLLGNPKIAPAYRQPKA